MSISRTSTSTSPNRPEKNPSPPNSGVAITKVNSTPDTPETSDPDCSSVQGAPKIKKRPGLEMLRVLWTGGPAFNEAIKSTGQDETYDCTALIEKAKTLGHKPEKMTKEEWIKLIEMNKTDKDKL